MPDTIKAVLFDLDGTLADTALDLGYALNKQRRLHGLPPLPQDTIRPYASHGTRGLLSVGFDLAPQDPAFPAMRDEYLKLYADNLCRHTQLFPGMPELLAELENRGILWGVVTNKPARFTVPLMEQLALSQRAACIVSGDSTANSKPHPEPLFHACAQINIPCGQCLYIGDAQRDIEAALAADMRVLIAAYGYLSADDQPETWQAHGIIATPQEILAYLP
jgi:phosphoglycolate phosphatase